MAAIGALALAFTAACSSSKASTTQTSANENTWNTINTASVKDGGTVTVGIEKQLGDWNPLDSSISADQVYALDGVYYAGAFISDPDGSVVLNTNTMASATLSSTSPETVVYKIKPGAVWSDGTPIDASDFVYDWLVNSGTDPNMLNASSTGYNDISSVVGSDGGKTVTVTFSTAFPDWKSLFGPLLPAHIAAKHGYDESMTLAQLTADVKAENGATTSTGAVLQLENSFNYFSNTAPPVSSGPYEVTNAPSDGSSVTETKNPKWYGDGGHLATMVFKYIADASQEPTALQNGEINVMYPQPETDLVTQVKGMGSSVKYQIAAGYEWEHFDFNLNSTALGGKTESAQEAADKVALRTAMLTAVDRKAIIARTVGLFDPASKPLNSRLFIPQQAGYTDNISKYGLGSGSSSSAESILKKAGFTGIGTALKYPDGTAVPALTMRYTSGNSIRQTECNLFASEMKALGITVNVETTSSLGKSLTHAAGYDYDVIVFAWVDTPFPNSGNYSLYVTGQGQNYGGYTSAQVDALYKTASSSFDTATVNSDLNKIDNILSQDAITLPLYQKDQMVAYDSTLGNVRINSTAQEFTYNVQEWGYVSGSASPSS
ncbi:ABC transporter family substrate-binding protein [Actinospica sp. MGRD01-02]|uniref:ABC transporter family substrate-binding protein n=1 Tax=Actinospica acidithermotolerans TaxID=2828514 RepID=A0A941IH04_9ACTN|nr:ABC transporter family substrate-binding protein [Actinospica acidithermotolerans]MBR7827985.1 ABC transporter family substrate-binding protein [Actinospica acidithermotolerans]